MKINKIKIGKRFRKQIGELETLKNSIKKLGLLHPIIISGNELIAGERRLRACKKLGWKEIETKEFKNLTEIEKREIELEENLKRKNLEWQEEVALRGELEKLVNPQGKHISSSDIVSDEVSQNAGISNRQLRRDIKLAKAVKKHPELLKEKTKSHALQKLKRIDNIKERKVGIIKSDSGIILGDCLKEIDKLKDNSISMILTDPPYGIDFVSNYRVVKDDITRPIENDDKRAVALLEKTLEKSYKKLSNNGCLYLFTTWKVIEKVKPIVARYYKIKNILIWNKNNWGMGDLNNWADKYEMIIYADKGKHKLLGDRPVNVLDFDRTSYKYHSCEKPIDLLSYLIEKSTVKDELVFDPFLGSGSVAVACKKTNRKYLGIEIDKLNYEITLKRLNGNY